MPVAIRPTRTVRRPLSGLGALLGVTQRAGGVVPAAPLTPMTPNGTDREPAISGVTHDSRIVRPGDLYAALPGTRVHGAEFSAAAVMAGATAILTDAAGRDRAAAAGVPVVVIADPRARLGEIACWVYGDPSRRLGLIGVTGTSGKTTTSYLIEAGLRRAGHVTGLIGGVETRIGADVAASELTTPEATDLQALLATMAERGVTAAAMEVSSHALALGRVAGTHYDVAVFTNLSQDHLDFHADLEDYFAAKAELFTPRYARSGVVNLTTPTDGASRPARPSPSPPSPRPGIQPRTGGPRTSGSARTAVRSGSLGLAAWRPTRHWLSSARSTWPTPWGRS